MKALLVFLLVAVLGGIGLYWLIVWSKRFNAHVSAQSVKAQVVVVDGARYVVVTSTDGVAVCPAVKP